MVPTLGIGLGLLEGLKRYVVTVEIHFIWYFGGGNHCPHYSVFSPLAFDPSGPRSQSLRAELDDDPLG
jgi:hypothetical protein